MAKSLYLFGLGYLGYCSLEYKENDGLYIKYYTTTDGNSWAYDNAIKIADTSNAKNLLKRMYIKMKGITNFEEETIIYDSYKTKIYIKDNKFIVKDGIDIICKEKIKDYDEVMNKFVKFIDSIKK